MVHAHHTAAQVALIGGRDDGTGCDLVLQRGEADDLAGRTKKELWSILSDMPLETNLVDRLTQLIARNFV